MTEVDFEYTVRDAVEADRAFIVETTARVRTPYRMTWHDWDDYGRCWARTAFNDPTRSCKVVEAKGVILAFVLAVDGHIEMLYCKAEFRGLGFGQLLLDAAGMDDNVPCRAPTDSWRMWASRRKIRFTVVK